MKRRFSPWLWIPVAGLALMLIANLAMVLAAKYVRPSRVSPQPYADSARFDDEKARAEAFTAAGGRLVVVSVGSGHVRCHLETPAGITLAGPAHVSCWRPDAPELDRRLEWVAVAEPIEIALSKAGRWRLTIDNEKPITAMDGMGFRCEAVVEVP
jgi:nitrogen fixation protein FixH